VKDRLPKPPDERVGSEWEFKRGDIDVTGAAMMARALLMSSLFPCASEDA